MPLLILVVAPVVLLAVAALLLAIPFAVPVFLTWVAPRRRSGRAPTTIAGSYARTSSS